MSRFLAEPPHQHGQEARTGVVLVNLGTPDRPDAPSLRRYLKQFLSDDRVVEIPKAIWWFILNLVILNVRPKRSAEKYALVWTGELLAKAANERLKFEQTFMISALSADGTDDLRKALASALPEGPFLYPEDQMSVAPMRHLAAEITREKIYQQLHQELPYQSTVETDSWTERKDNSVRIEQTIYVERESQRKIVLGKGGATIKSIGAAARKELAEILGHPVHLFLFVKVREDWGNDPDRYREMGLEFPRE